MRVGLTYDAGQPPIPSVSQLYADLLPGAELFAFQLGLEDPEGAASGACADVVFVRRYQDRWKPGTGVIHDYLYIMVTNRLRDVLRSQKRRQRWANEAATMRTTFQPAFRGSYDDDAPDEAEPGYYDAAMDTADTMADLDRLRQRVAGDPFFSELLDVMAGRALAAEPPTTSGICEAMTSSPCPNTVRTRRAQLAQMAEGYLG